MTNYDFSTLNDKEFEILVADLLSAEIRVRFERFKSGKDGGVDGRYFLDSKRQVVFQCKHWVNTPIQALLKTLEKTELPKVLKLKPTRYILVTSVKLSANDKAKIYSIFNESMRSESDVFGHEDINDLLRKHSHIERSHVKLWLRSAGMMQIFANSAILGRSNFTLNQIHEKSRSYVSTEAHQKAEEKFRKNNVILITGEPGIGKTTLAEQLCLNYVANGYQLCVAARNIEELEAIYTDDRAQIFYFDDFLGSNYLAALSRHEDSHIVGFIKRVGADKTKRFILTSRTTILNRGKALTDRFRNEKIEQHEFEIKIGQLSLLDKARILYNSIWYSGLPRDYIEVILADQRYREIVGHKNFNPRLISFITDHSRFSEVLPERYWAYIEHRLCNPKDVWEHAYDNQLDDWSRVLLSLVVFSGKSIDEPDLERAFDRIKSLSTMTFSGEHDFGRCIQVLVGSLINRTIEKNRCWYSLFNPSIADYVLRRVTSNESFVSLVILALAENDSFKIFRELRENKILSKLKAARIVERICYAELKNNLNSLDIPRAIQIMSLAAEFCAENPPVSEIVLKQIERICCIDEERKYTHLLAPVIRYLVLEKKLDDDLLQKLLSDYDFGGLDHEYLLQFSGLLSILPKSVAENVVPDLKYWIVRHWENSFHDEVTDRGVLDELYGEDENDETEAESILEELLDEILSQYHIKFSYHDNYQIIGSCSVESIFEQNVRRRERRYVGKVRVPSREIDANDDIDDLFNIDFPPER